MSKSVWANIVRLYAMLSHAFANKYPGKPSAKWSEWSDKCYEQMPRSATRPGVLKVIDDRLAYLVLKRKLLGPPPLCSTNSDCFVPPVNVIELQVGDLGSAKSVDGT